MKESHACRNSDMGRKLHHAFKKAGFEDLEISIYAKADVDGRLLGMIRNMAKYARDSDTMDLAKIDHVVTADEAVFFSTPQDLAIAVASIESKRPIGRSTIGVERAGGSTGKYSAKSSLRAARSFASPNQVMTFTTSPIDELEHSRQLLRFLKACLACASKLSPALVPVSGSIPACPDTKMKSPARTTVE